MQGKFSAVSLTVFSFLFLSGVSFSKTTPQKTPLKKVAQGEIFAPDPDPAATGCCYIRCNSVEIKCTDPGHEQTKCNQQNMDPGPCTGKFQSGCAVEFYNGTCSEMFAAHPTYQDKTKKTTADDPE